MSTRQAPATGSDSPAKPESRKPSRRRFGSVEQLESGRFRARYRGPDAVMYAAPVTFPTVADADAWLATVQADLVRAVWKAPRYVRETLSAYGWRWIEQRDVRDSTRELYSIMFRCHVEPYIGQMRLDRITPDVVRDWHARLGQDAAESAEARRKASKRPTQATAQTGASTQARAYRLLRAVLATAVEDELLPRNPCKLRGASTYRTVERPVLTVREVEQLAGEVPEHMRTLVYVLAWCGLRLGEACELRSRDVDLVRQTLTVSRSVYRVGGVYRVGEPKSDAGRRTVSVPAFVCELLTAHMRARKVAGPDALVFQTVAGPSRGSWAYTSAQNVITRGLRDIGRPDVRVHDLRHTGQVLAAQNGATLAELRSRMGHSTLAAAQVYMHTTAEHGAQTAQRMDEYRAEVIQLPVRRAK